MRVSKRVDDRVRFALSSRLSTFPSKQKYNTAVWPVYFIVFYYFFVCLSLTRGSCMRLGEIKKTLCMRDLYFFRYH